MMDTRLLVDLLKRWWWFYLGIFAWTTLMGTMFGDEGMQSLGLVAFPIIMVSLVFNAELRRSKNFRANRMLPVPEGIHVLNNWGPVLVVDSNGGFLAGGDHMNLTGSEQTFIDWLKTYDVIWRGKPGTSVMMQQFEAAHIS